MLKASLLALCLDAALMLAVSQLPEASAGAGVGTEPAILLVKIDPQSRASTPQGIAGLARAAEPVLPTPRDTPRETTPFVEPVSEATPQAAIQAAAEVPVTKTASTPSDTRPDGLAGDQAAGRAADEPVSAGRHADTAAYNAELVRHIDALVRERLVYPALARRRNIEGVVKLTLLIDEHGRLDGSALVSGSGSSILDKAAIALVQDIFPITLSGGLEEPVHISIMISYSLTS